ncbi:MAG: TlpA family protein disulfide reductase [Bacteroidales bacterium]|nr:TlpA family protein disulfide reductase [Bacteroidales bacterium]
MRTYWKIILSVVVAVLAMLSGALYWINQFTIVGALYFVGAFLLVDNNTRKITTILLLIAPFFAIYGTLVLYESLLNVYPIVFIPFISAALGLGAKCWYLKSGRKKSILLFSVLYLLIFAFAGFIFMHNWLDFEFNREYKNNKVSTTDVNLYDFSGAKIPVDTFQNKIMVLDYWSLGCGVCFELFPEFEKLTNHYSAKEVVFFAVYIPLRKKDEPDYLEQSLSYIRKQNYSFPLLKTDSLSAANLGINSVPRMIIINKNKEIVYTGCTSFKYKKFVIGNFYSIIDKLLKE